MLNLLNHLYRNFLSALSSQTHLSIQLDINNACNLACTHCYHSDHKDSGALSLDQWKDVLKQYETLLAKLRFLPAITICGGEPTISKNLRPLIQWIRVTLGPNVPIDILSNGTKITVELADFFLENSVQVQISLDGPTEETHDRVRGKGAFSATMRGVSLLQERGVPVWFLAVLSKRTAPLIPAFFQLTASLGVKSMNFTRLVPQGAGQKLVESGEDSTLLGEDLKQALQLIKNEAQTSKVATRGDLPLYALIDESTKGHHLTGFQGIVVDYQGNLKVTSRTDFKVGSLLKTDLSTLFLNNPIFKALRRGAVTTCGECKFYPRCGGNRGIAYAVTGSYTSHDPGCWLTETERKTALIDNL